MLTLRPESPGDWGLILCLLAPAFKLSLSTRCRHKTKFKFKFKYYWAPGRTDDIYDSMSDD